MTALDILDKLQCDVQRNAALKEELLATRREANPLDAFCRKCREYGYELYAMEVVQAGEEMYAQMKRSTNGGGENSPMLEGEDDLYELFFAGLEGRQ